MHGTLIFKKKKNTTKKQCKLRNSNLLGRVIQLKRFYYNFFTCSIADVPNKNHLIINLMVNGPGVQCVCVCLYIDTSFVMRIVAQITHLF